MRLQQTRARGGEGCEEGRLQRPGRPEAGVRRHHQTQLRSSRAEGSRPLTSSLPPQVLPVGEVQVPGRDRLCQGQIPSWSLSCYLTLQDFQGELLRVPWEDGKQQLLSPFSRTFPAFGDAPSLTREPGGTCPGGGWGAALEAGGESPSPQWGLTGGGAAGLER